MSQRGKTLRVIKKREKLKARTKRENQRGKKERQQNREV